MKAIHTLLYLFIGLISTTLLAQDSKNIEIKSAGFGERNEKKHPGANILVRNNQEQVHIYHEGIDMFCDKALFYGQDNFIEAYGNVRIHQGDSINLTAKYAEYSGNTKLAFVSGNVILREPNSTLTTDTLYFNKQAQEAYYKSGGRVVRDTTGTITSRTGHYYIKQNKYRFTTNVELVNPEYTLTTAQLDFYTETGIAYMYGPSNIKGEKSNIYAERGFYNTKSDFGYFNKNAQIDYETRKIEGDSLYFNRNRNFASASNNITLTDTINNSIIKGHYAEVHRAKDSVFITKRALIISTQEKDSVYMHADTLMITGKAENRITRAYRNAKIYKTDLSAKADSIHVNHKTGLTQLINFYSKKRDFFSKKKRPILWSEENQMTGDTIHLKSNPETEKIDSLIVFKNAFIISKDSLSTDGYNQTSGQRLIGLFDKKNQIKQIDILKNAQSIYYARNEEGELIGIEKGKSANISIFFENQEMIEIRRILDPEQILYKPEELPKKERIFNGFYWREDERPRSVEDLFSEDPPLNLPVIKGLEDIEPDSEFFSPALIKRIKKADKKETNKIKSKGEKVNKNDSLKASRHLPKTDSSTLSK